MLQSNFCDLNYVAIAKILKKHDKISNFKDAKPKALPMLRNPELFPQTQSLDRLRRNLQVEIFW
jgi:SPX domain protein involved in polyphosphate accumulation